MAYYNYEGCVGIGLKSIERIVVTVGQHLDIWDSKDSAYKRLTPHPTEYKEQDAIFNKNEKCWCMKTNEKETFLFVLTGRPLP